jgi:hemoglobin-like flavoprotein
VTPREIALVQSSWREVQPLAEPAAAMFYARLFEIEPSLRRLFKGDMKEQGRKVMAMIGVAVSALTRLESVVPAVQALGRRHAAYGVEDRHYAVVEEALVWTLGRGLGASFTKEVEQAWRAAYGLLAATMKQAADVKEEIHAANG